MAHHFFSVSRSQQRSSMIETEAARNFVAQMRAGLAEFAQRTDELMLLRGFSREESVDLPHIWLEAAVDVTNQDIASRNEAAVVAQVGFVAAALERGDAMLCKALDCTYVESLLWNIKDSRLRQWAWSLFPDVIKHYYEQMWGPWRG